MRIRGTVADGGLVDRCYLPDAQTAIARPYGLTVLTLQGDQISAITWFGDCLARKASVLAARPRRPEWTIHESSAAAGIDYCTAEVSRRAPTHSKCFSRPFRSSDGRPARRSQPRAEAEAIAGRHAAG